MLSRHFFPFYSGLEDDPSLASRISIFLFYVSIYLKDALSAWISASFVVALIAMGLMVGFAAIHYQRKTKTSPGISTLVLALCICFWLLSAPLNGSFQVSAYYIAIPCAYVIMNTSPRLFLRLLVLHLFVSLAIQGIEYASSSYLFVYTAKDSTALDEKLFGGGADVFRAKGLFQGPLSAVAFAYWIAFLGRGKVFPVLILAFCAFFAGGRLGLSIAALLLLIRVFLQDKTSVSIPRERPRRFWKIASTLCMLSVLATFFILSNKSRLDFIASAYDTGNSQNASRFLFWLSSIQYFMNYSFVEKVFGNFGLVANTMGGTENDFLRILLDHGLIALSLYIFALGYGLIAAIRRRDLEGGLLIFVVIILMNVFPFIQSLSSTVLFWLFIFLVPRFAAVPSATTAISDPIGA